MSGHSSNAVGVPARDSTHVLFVGNSQTYTNDLPAAVAAIAASAGDRFIVAVAAAPDVALIDHLRGATDALQLVKSRRWDYVVLQQGPSTMAANRDSLVEWARLFEPHIRAAGARPALFMTWPARAQWERMSLVRQSYEEAARAVDGILLPAGEAWRLAHKTDPSLSMYGPDQFHPSGVGTFLAALVIYELLSGRDVRTLPAKAFAHGSMLDLPEATIRLLHEAAHAGSVPQAPR